VLGMVDALRWVHEDTDEIHGYELPAHSRSKFVLAAASAAVSAKFARLSREACRLSPLIPKRPIVDQNFVLCQPLRPARKRAGSWSRGAYGIFPDRRTEVGSSTRHTASRRLALSSGENNGWVLAKDLRGLVKKGRCT
jgi:hypothetical protein